MSASLKTLYGVILLCFTLYLAACGGGSETENQPVLSPLSSLILSLSSRPDITGQNVYDLLGPSSEQAAKAFVDALDANIDPSPFFEALAPIVQTYRDAYQFAPSGLLGIDEKALALDRLLFDVIDATEQAGISLQESQTAFASAFAVLEGELATSLSNGSISDLDYEMVDLLLLHAVNDLNLRGYFIGIPMAMLHLDVDTAHVTWLQEKMNFAPGNFIAMATSLESLLADPEIFSDSSLTVQEQFDQEAMRDLFLTRFSLELLFFQQDISIISDRMAAMGGIMTAMTPERLYHAGYAREMITGSPPVTEYVMPLDSFSIYSWVSPSRPVNYRQDPTLVNELRQFGVGVPAPPDFSILSGSYLAMAKLDYDLDLCRLIAQAEWDQAADESFNLIGQIPSMSKRSEILKANRARRIQVLERVVGTMDTENQAFELLLTAFSR